MEIFGTMGLSRDISLSVVIPVNNEEKNIPKLTEEIYAALEDKYSFEVIFVNDGSTDLTDAALEDCSQQYPWLGYISHSQSFGQSAAVRTGVRGARGKVIVTLDGDGQNDPADIPDLYEKLMACSNPDLLLIIGKRFDRQDSWVRTISSKAANALRSRLLKDSTPDGGCGLKAFTKAAFLEFPFFDHMHRFSPALMIRLGGQVESIEVNHRKRLAGSSKYGVLDRLWVGIVDLFGVMWLIQRAKNVDITKFKGPEM